MSAFNSVISCAAEWPTEIQHLACLLDSPIPSRLSNGPCPAVSSRAFPLLEELRNILVSSPEQLTESPSEVLDILDLVLSTVGALRALSCASKDNATQSTIAFWSLLIRSLAFVCYDKSYTLQEAAFVRPRLSHVRSFMEDGRASLIVSHVVENIQRPKPVVDDEASGRLPIGTAERSNKPSQEECDSETSYDDESSSDSDTSYERTEASTDPTSAQSSYIPLDAHVLASWRHPNSVVLPYLCVTDEDEIFSLMSGVVYQRSTWGISEPVIGIILSKTGFVGRVVLGWLDKVCVDPDVLPAVRFAHADGTRTDSSLGVYDLTDPVSALKFAQFIISLRAHVEGIVAQCQTPTFKRVSWRSDTIDDDDSGSEEQWEQRIICWLNTVESDTNQKGSSDPSSPNHYSFVMDDSERRITRASSKARSARHPRRSMSADSKREPPPAEPAPYLPDVNLTYPREPSLGATRSRTPSGRASAQPDERGRQETQTDGGSSNDGKTGKRSKSAGALSCSRLGGKSLAGISPTAKLSFSSYAHDRKVISLTNVPLQKNVEGKEESDTKKSKPSELDIISSEIDTMLQFYDKMTRYLKPPIAEGLPVVDKRVECVREHFLIQASKCPDGENTPEVSQRHWGIISGCFSSLLWASVGGYSKERGAKSQNEAEARHEWDVLLNLGFVSAPELASGRVVLERALSLSRNVAADLVKSSVQFDGGEFHAVAQQSSDISRRVENVLYERGSSSMSDLVIQTSHVVITTLMRQRAVSHLFADAVTAKNAILKRAGNEPEFGIVDAILTIPLGYGQENSEPLVRVSETRESLQVARTLNADNIVEPTDDLVSEEPSSKAKGHVKHARSRHASARAKSTSTSMVAIQEEQEPPQRTKDDEKNNATPIGRPEDWMHPFAVTCSETKLAPKLQFPSGVVMNVKELLNKLLLVVLVAEYKKPTQTYTKALVQAKMYLEASVRYVASLGVMNQGVFALVTDGVEGAVLMAWCSRESENVYIVERNIRTFNISSPIDVYHFMTVLLRLREYGDTTLKDAVEKALQAEDFKQTSWSKAAQYARME
ncbi:uncharacterized protein BT62DRAFT_938820 [Guyanagaster necrorhizus]|uniref:Uncharacterized protein n=1 Tax=Guyanagaster necrorhizus TaxID=856835 RepID=A0A9P7VFG6_9AGAR|nr:uncharacterized protein BT62DRAFT_938820 [Guyanagaster necrorhizus MCA 3950]KAG7439598.1 hypothetical protein BT62DRAFT_938820 [Guyanagaster necrorhizus MCA 3950]